MDYTLKDKVVLVTGSSRGIGRATALEFARSGASVVINDVKNDAAAQEVVGQIIALGQKAICVRADVSREEDVRALIEKSIAEFGRLDVLVNNAGIVYDIESWQDTTREQWQDTLNVHVFGNFFCSKYAAPYLEKTRGCIVNIASTNGYTEHYPESLAYNAAKASIVSMTHDLAKALAPLVRVNAVAPGWVDTDMNAGLSKEYMTEQAEQIYLKRIAKPEEIASVVVFLASERASFVTGMIVRADGGHD
jgi:3-oxoacyl-[acyl-carrier protein] reductase